MQLLNCFSTCRTFGSSDGENNKGIMLFMRKEVWLHDVLSSTVHVCDTCIYTGEVQRIFENDLQTFYIVENLLHLLWKYCLNETFLLKRSLMRVDKSLPQSTVINFWLSLYFWLSLLSATLCIDFMDLF